MDMPATPRRLLPSMSALTALEAAARTGSISAAARELALTQGAVSQHISALEQQLGQRLITRSVKGISLTPAGQNYCNAAEAALRLLRDAALDLLADTSNHQLTLAMVPTFGTRWLLPRLPRFVAANPHITLHFMTRIGQFDLAAAGVDAALHAGEKDWPGAQSVPLMRETVAPVCSPAFLTRNPLSSPTELQALPLLHLASRPGAWDHWFDSLGLGPPPRSPMVFEQFLGVAEAARAGLGVALMPLFLIENELASGELTLAWPHRIESLSAYYLIIPNNRLTHAPTARFKSWILDEIASGPTEPA